MLRLLSTFFNGFGQRDSKGYVGFLGCEIVLQYREGVEIVFPNKKYSIYLLMFLLAGMKFKGFQIIRV